MAAGELQKVKPIAAAIPIAAVHSILLNDHHAIQNRIAHLQLQANTLVMVNEQDIRFKLFISNLSTQTSHLMETYQLKCVLRVSVSHKTSQAVVTHIHFLQCFFKMLATLCVVNIDFEAILQVILMHIYVSIIFIL